MACNIDAAMGSLPLMILLLTGGPDMPPDQGTAPLTQASTPSDVPAPITGIGRLNWAVGSTIGPASLWTGVLSSTWGTVFNNPREYGESFDGFAKRYGLRLTGVAASNVTEASLGLIWREDPRYHRDPLEESYGRRFVRTVKMTFMSNRDGELIPAYARFIAIAGTNALSNSWRPDSERTVGNTIDRISMGFGGRLLGNMWEEFWPDVRQHLPFFRKH
jgi:hypothetical protein